ncbi:YbaB/EbfC family nucleoid-associated protein [bacterium]|nr:YbaB/EbfC family nucleoid-associated protein [bacterium]
MDINKMMREAQKLQAKMQQDMQQAQEQLAEERIEGSAGGGAVSCVVNGHKQLISIKIAPEAVDPADIDTLQDLVFLAVSDALSSAERRAEEVMEKVRGGLKIPGLDMGGFGF